MHTVLEVARSGLGRHVDAGATALNFQPWYTQRMPFSSLRPQNRDATVRAVGVDETDRP